MIRLTIILLLLLAGTPRVTLLPAARHAPGAPAAPATGTAVPACCAAAGLVNAAALEVLPCALCCGTETCSASHGAACTCGVRPMRDSDPAPPVPMPTAPRDLVVLVRIDRVVTLPAPAAPTMPCVERCDGTLRATRSSHEFRAVLGIWLT